MSEDPSSSPAPGADPSRDPGDESDSPPSVSIDGLAAGGDAVGRLPDGRVVFVDGAAPGDRVTLVDLRDHKRFLRARVGRVLEPGPDRTQPRCPHFGVCGGCRWQHLQYPAQLAAKQRIVRDALERIGGLRLPGAASDPDPIEIVPSPDPWAYRARARWVEASGGIGYRERGGALPVPVEVCPVLLPAAEAALRERSSAVRSEAPVASGPRRSGRRRAPREWVVTATPEGAVRVDALRGGRVRRPPVAASGSDASEASEGSEASEIAIELLGDRLRVGGTSFVQGNALLWEALAREVRDRCLAALEGEGVAENGGAGPRASQRRPRFVELYAGIGFFTLPLLRAGLDGVVFESDRSALSDLAWSLRRAGLSERVDVLAGRVERRGDLFQRLSAADVVLVDPPRSGLEPAVRAAILRAAPPRLVYVSCDPATLARDLRALAGEPSGDAPTSRAQEVEGALPDAITDDLRGRYAIESLKAFDLFPQTPHVETVVSLTRVEAPGRQR